MSICGIASENFPKLYDNICIGFGYCDNFALSDRKELVCVGSSRVPTSSVLQKIKNSHLHANRAVSAIATPCVTSNNELDQLHGTNRQTDKITLTSNRELIVMSHPILSEATLIDVPYLTFIRGLNTNLISYEKSTASRDLRI